MTEKTIDANRMYTLKEAGQLLGGVSAQTAWRWVRAGKIPAARPGKAWLIRGADLLALRDTARKDTSEQ